MYLRSEATHSFTVSLQSKGLPHTTLTRPLPCVHFHGMPRESETVSYTIIIFVQRTSLDLYFEHFTICASGSITLRYMLPSVSNPCCLQFTTNKGLFCLWYLALDLGRLELVRGRICRRLQSQEMEYGI